MRELSWNPERQLRYNEMASRTLDGLMVREHEAKVTLAQLAELVALQSVRLLELEEKVERLERGT